MNHSAKIAPSADSPGAHAPLEAFFARLARAPRAALLLDYDGTLAPFQTDPAAARPYPGVTTALRTLMHETDTRVVVVSGRWLATLVPLLDLDPLPELWGCHGRERMLPGAADQLTGVDAQAANALATADTWQSALEALGAHIERKPASLAVHWRGAAHAREAIESAIRERVRLHLLPGALEWLNFDGGVELCAPGFDKGHAVHTVTAETGADAAVAYLGDDLTDEAAFAALREPDLGVLVRADVRPTRARVHLRPPDELLGFLRRWIDVRGKRA